MASDARSVETWTLFGKEVRQQAISLLDVGPIRLGQNGLAQPNVFAAALLSRTITNFKGVLVLASEGLVNEARTLTRSCFENVLWMRRLAAEKELFVQAIFQDHRCQERSFAKTLLSLPKVVDEMDRVAIQSRVDLELRFPKISPADSLTEEEAKKDYLIFRSLSNDAAHPSVASLSAHIDLSQRTSGPELVIEPSDSGSLMLNTVQVATISLLNAMRVYLDIVPNKGALYGVNATIERYNILANELMVEHQ